MATTVDTTDGETAVRVFEWVDLQPRSRRLDPVAVGRALAALHRAGTPTDRPELTALVKLIGEPSGSRKAFSVKVAGAVSRPSIVWTLPVAAL